MMGQGLDVSRVPTFLIMDPYIWRRELDYMLVPPDSAGDQGFAPTLDWPRGPVPRWAPFQTPRWVPGPLASRAGPSSSHVADDDTEQWQC